MCSSICGHSFLGTILRNKQKITKDQGISECSIQYYVATPGYQRLHEVRTGPTPWEDLDKGLTSKRVCFNGVVLNEVVFWKSQISGAERSLCYHFSSVFIEKFG